MWMRLPKAAEFVNCDTRSPKKQIHGRPRCHKHVRCQARVRLLETHPRLSPAKSISDIGSASIRISRVEGQQKSIQYACGLSNSLSYKRNQSVRENDRSDLNQASPSDVGVVRQYFARLEQKRINDFRYPGPCLDTHGLVGVHQAPNFASAH